LVSFQVIGCASGMPHPHLASSSYIVELSGRVLLFDAGDGVSSALRRCGVDPRRIERIFLSHLHPDHSMGLPLLIQMNFLLKRVEPLTVFLPAEAAEGFQHLLDLTYLFRHKLGFELQIVKIERGFCFEDHDIKVLAHPNKHLVGHREYLGQSNLANRMECSSFTIEVEGKKIVYSADLGGLEDLLPILPATDLLVIDGMHIVLEQLPAIALQHGIKRVMLTHLPENFDFDSARESIAKAGYQHLLKASEGMIIPL